MGKLPEKGGFDSLPIYGRAWQERGGGVFEGWGVNTPKHTMYHWILDIRINLGAKFQLKLTILIFRTKFAQKEYFRLKAEKEI